MKHVEIDDPRRPDPGMTYRDPFGRCMFTLPPSYAVTSPPLPAGAVYTPSPRYLLVAFGATTGIERWISLAIHVGIPANITPADPDHPTVDDLAPPTVFHTLSALYQLAVTPLGVIEAATLGGEAARRYAFRAAGNGNRWCGVQIVALRDGTAYYLTFTATDTDFDAFMRDVQITLDTFTFLDTPMEAGEWMMQLHALMKQDQDGDYVVDEASFAVEAFQALLRSPPAPPVSVTVHEKVAQYGAFGVYRLSVTMPDGQTVESQPYSLYLGEIAVPLTLPFAESVNEMIGSALLVGTVPRDHATRTDVIAALEKRQTRQKRYWAKVRSQTPQWNAQLEKAATWQETKTAQVQEAFARLKQEG